MSPAIGIEVLIRAHAALKMVKDLPVDAKLTQEQWMQVMHACNALGARLPTIAAALPPVEIEGVAS